MLRSQSSGRYTLKAGLVRLGVRVEAAWVESLGLGLAAKAVDVACGQCQAAAPLLKPSGGTVMCELRGCTAAAQTNLGMTKHLG